MGILPIRCRAAWWPRARFHQSGRSVGDRHRAGHERGIERGLMEFGRPGGGSLDLGKLIKCVARPHGRPERQRLSPAWRHPLTEGFG